MGVNEHEPGTTQKAKMENVQNENTICLLC